MNIVIISNCSPRDILVLQHLRTGFDNVIIIRHKRSNSFLKRRPKNQGHFAFIGKKVLSRLRNNSLRKKSPVISLDDSNFKIIDFDHGRINSQDGLEMLRSLDTDLLVTCHAPLLSGSVLKVAKVAAINVHYGIPPQYRGFDTLFWPWFKKDSDHIGGSIHYINAGVDTGDVLAKVYPALEKSDSETDFDIKTADLLGIALTKVLAFIINEGHIPIGERQVGKGRNYKRVDRTLWISIKAILFHNLGMINPKPRKAKIDFFLTKS